MIDILNDHPFAVGIDLGSNTLRIVAVACDTGEILYSDEVIVRTADGLETHQTISNSATARIIEGLHRLLSPFPGRLHTLRAVTTEALRRAANAREVLKQVYQETEIQFEIIDAQEEARLTLLAVEKRLEMLHIKRDTFVLVDIGGGSTELIVKCEDRISVQSFPLGIVTLTEASADAVSLDALLSEKLLPMQIFWESVQSSCEEIGLFVATAGTPTTIAAMKLDMGYAEYESGKINGTLLSRSDLMSQGKKLLTMSSEARKKAVGVGREDLIVTGIKIFDAIYALLGMKEAVVIDDGLREGVAADLCNKLI